MDRFVINNNYAGVIRLVYRLIYYKEPVPVNSLDTGHLDLSYTGSQLAII